MPPHRDAWFVGLMTGTVLDGNIDIALLRTDGETVSEFGPWTLAEYDDPTRTLLAEALAQALAWQFEGPEPEVFRQAEDALTRAQSAAVTVFLDRSGIAPAEVAAIGFHGQTVLHRAPRPGRRGDTRQLGDGASMAALTGIDVVHDFRTADVRAGGQGAPLSASYHAALLVSAGLPPSTAVLNLGGVANITWRGVDGRLCAFDTGPANAPLNDWVGRATGQAMDRDGALARQGRVDEQRLARLLEHPFLAAPFPKSLDRFDFPAAMADGLEPCRRGGDADRVHRRRGGARARPAARAPHPPRCVRRRPPQSGDHGGAGCPRRGGGGRGRGGRLARRRDRGRVFRVPRGPLAARLADQLLHHHRRAGADDRRPPQPAGLREHLRSYSL